jgi:multidrug efflux system membrane fusion protein
MEKRISYRPTTTFGYLALTLLLGCATPTPSAPPPPAVTVATVASQEITEWDEFTGRFEAVDAVEIRPRVSGYIRRVVFAEGKEVRKGDVLFEIDPRPYEADLARAQAELEQAQTAAALAKRDVERGQRLVQINALSREEFDGRTTAAQRAEAAIQIAEAAVTTAKLNLEWTVVRSPISGRVGRAEVTEGNLIQAGSATPLTSVVSLDPIYVTFEGDEQSYLKYAELSRKGTRNGNRTPISLGLADEGDRYPWTGYVDFVDNQLNPETGTIRIRAVVSNKDRRFTPGLYARVKLVGSGQYAATLIQDRAIGTDQDKKFVMVLGPDSTVTYRAIKLGRMVNGLRIVQDGLKPGEQIVINGLQRIRTGAKVLASVEAMTPATSTVAVNSK